MRVFLTGASGFIGSFIAEALLQKGYQVRCLVRTSSNLRWLADLDVECFYGSLDDLGSLKRGLQDTDYIIHAAGLTSALSKEELLKVNYHGTKNLLSATIESNPGLKRFVLISSQAAAGPGQSLQAIDETWEPRPITEYGRSKLLSERSVLQYKDKLPSTIIRPPAVYGPRDKETLKFFKTVKQGLIPQVDGKTKFLSIIYVKDLAEETIRAMESEKTRGQTYFFANPQPQSWEDIARIVLRYFNKKGIRLHIPSLFVQGIAVLSEGLSRLTLKPSKLNRQTVLDMKEDFWICSPHKAQSDFDFNPQTSLQQGIQETLDWYKEMGWI